MAQDNKKPKLVRDSFTIPKAEYAAIEQLKQRTIGLGGTVKKSELLRAGLMLLQSLNDAAFRRAINAVPTLKTGRPTAEQPPQPATTVVLAKPAAPARKAAPKAAKPTAPRAAPAAAPVVRKPAAKPAVKPAAPLAVKPVAQPAAKPAAKPVTKLAVKPTEKVAEKAAEKAIDKAAEKASAA